MIKRVKNKKIPKEKSLYFKNIQGCQEHHFMLSLAAHASLKVLGIVSYEFYSDCRIYCHYVSIRSQWSSIHWSLQQLRMS